MNALKKSITDVEISEYYGHMGTYFMHGKNSKVIPCPDGVDAVFLLNEPDDNYPIITSKVLFFEISPPDDGDDDSTMAPLAIDPWSDYPGIINAALQSWDNEDELHFVGLRHGLDNFFLDDADTRVLYANKFWDFVSQNDETRKFKRDRRPGKVGE